MTDLGQTIDPKSDQLNADDLIAGPITITITKVSAASSEQPIAISFEGDNQKPYMPCKSMRRVLVQMWGRDGSKYVGRSMTLYRDPSVRFGGIEVGGIRISHMSHIDGPKTMALTATRAQRKPFTVKPLEQKTAGRPPLSSGADRSSDQALAAWGERADSPAPDLARFEDDVDTGSFHFIAESAKGRSSTVDGDRWSAYLCSLIDPPAAYDAAESAWKRNKAHVEAAYAAGQGEFAKRVEAAWKKRERALDDAQ